MFLPHCWSVRTLLVEGGDTEVLGYVPFSLFGCLVHGTLPSCSGKTKCILRDGSQPVFLWVRNDKDWDGGCGSQSPGQPDTTGNLEELRMGGLGT